MKKLIEKTKIFYQKSFTLIELIVVIVVIGILAAIVIPNISSFKEEASVTAMVADGKNLQTAVDLYQLENHGDFPTIKEEDSTNPTLGLPQSVDFNALYPAYIRDLPQAKNMYYWIDYQGQFYYSTIDNPNDFTQGDSELTWTANEDASGYKIYEAESSTTGSSKKVTIKEVSKLSGDTNSFIPMNYSKEKQYLINVVDENGYEAPPVKSQYEGTTPFSPIDTEKNKPSLTPEQEELVNEPTNKMVSVGQDHTMVVNGKGELWSFGNNYYGQLGHSINSGTSNPNPIPEKVMDGVKSVFSGASHTLVIKENGELWSFGNNYFGQLGHSKNLGIGYQTPEKVMDGVKSVSSGAHHTLVINEDNELWSFGYNLYGQLGYSTNSGTANPNPTPKKVLDGVKSVSAGYHHTLFINESNELWSFGYNYYGALGYSTNSRTVNPNPTPQKVMDGAKFVSAGGYHTLVIKENNELWSFGYNLNGQLGYSANNGTSNANPTPQKVMDGAKSMSAGSYHSLIIKENDELWAFGYNEYGQLGSTVNNGTSNPNPTPEKVMDGVKSVSSGSNHSMVFKEKNALWSFGQNNFGQLGYVANSEDSSPNPTPVQVYLNN